LDAMVEMGLLQRGILDRRTNEYRITDAGQVVLADRHRWTDPSDSAP
jgi:DNA-binding PadR family transcriptional regulator